MLQIARFAPLFVDFDTKRSQDMGRRSGLVRACKPAEGIKILDATAGWGRDASVLAHRGAEVLMLERHPMMSALLADGLRRCTHLKLSLLPLDAKTYLSTLEPSEYPDVIYLDPMHPLRQKSALVKKDMQALQQCIGVDEDAKEVLVLALTRARQRIVIKWPQRSPPLYPPDVSIPGTTIRFDMYWPRLSVENL